MASVNVMRKVEISSDAVYVDGVALPVCGSGEAMLDWIYRTHVGGYPKYHKMDLLCKLGFIAS